MFFVYKGCFFFYKGYFFFYKGCFFVLQRMLRLRIWRSGPAYWRSCGASTRWGSHFAQWDMLGAVKLAAESTGQQGTLFYFVVFANCC